MSLKHAIDKAFDGTDPDAIRKLRPQKIKPKPEVRIVERIVYKQRAQKEYVTIPGVPKGRKLSDLKKSFMDYQNTDSYNKIFDLLSKVYSPAYVNELLLDAFKAGYTTK